MTASFSCFVTGTDTEIGKTLIASALTHGLAQTGVQVAAMKPVAAGATVVMSSSGEVWHNDDADQLAQAANVVLPMELAVPYLLREPAAPHIVAKRENVRIDLAHILACYKQVAAQADAVVVEGVGGFCVPLNDELDTADLARQLGLPVIMTVGLRLGCISHALLTAEAIAARGLKLVGWVANTVDETMRYAEDNVEALAQRLPAPLLGCVPRLAAPLPAAAAGYLDFSCLPGWPGKRVA
ncbi:MAG TPA: dethiobiotin synthase [Oxalicibacterium sp.]|jgi:dethiobiotin synthetase|nr:dethiobiotin synthase [Oxalicibacterium sp.]